ncbi:MAG: type II secretion system F family protein [Elusimicrobiaceae bacterium]|jgi:tight adherence protein C|nr:type II secretion system F family protein [Elusimicrobiaceae bacterium]MBT3954635.1 type II secretion system F family protein [Elusimicrobiaceae bacterium]MBT4007943.1 type II secretion system F family protein [Elusimicrobiaceae bacterium]MBT4403268.1 type II secretion system F family protein [Elusimicrobiaceae bacterium]MBT4439957.1 type II secretion system F family protein [Elusimicrobiaceae bacterium]
MATFSIIEGILLKFVILVGTINLFWFVFRLITPAKKDESFVDIEAKESKAASVLADLNKDKNILHKLDYFVLETFGLSKKLEQTHLLLGSPTSPNPLQMLHMKMIWAVVLPIVLFLVFQSTFFALIGLVLGFYIPDMQFDAKIKKRQESLLAHFSTTVDLAALVIESGLDYLTAFERIIKQAKEKTVLEEELSKMINEVQLGYSRREALERMAARTGTQEFKSFVGLIIQSDELGTSLVDLLRNFSIDMRFRRLNRAEKLAAQASTKMLIPLFIFIFPTVFVLILAPMIKDMLGGGMPF